MTLICLVLLSLSQIITSVHTIQLVVDRHKNERHLFFPIRYLSVALGFVIPVMIALILVSSSINGHITSSLSPIELHPPPSESRFV
jgi:hypothetical protein